MWEAFINAFVSYMYDSIEIWKYWTGIGIGLVIGVVFGYDKGYDRGFNVLCKKIEEEESNG